MVLRLVLVALIAGIALSGCGRRGSLEAPPGVEDASPVPKPGRFPQAGERPADEPFVLDGLL